MVCSLCQTIWTRGLPTRDSSIIPGLVLDKSFPQSLYNQGVILKRPRDTQHGDINPDPRATAQLQHAITWKPHGLVPFFGYSLNVSVHTWDPDLFHHLSFTVVDALLFAFAKRRRRNGKTFTSRAKYREIHSLLPSNVTSMTGRSLQHTPSKFGQDLSAVRRNSWRR